MTLIDMIKLGALIATGLYALMYAFLLLITLLRIILLKNVFKNKKFVLYTMPSGYYLMVGLVITIKHKDLDWGFWPTGIITFGGYIVLLFAGLVLNERTKKEATDEGRDY